MASSKIRLAVLATGGTIAGTGNHANSAQYTSAILGIEHLLQQLPVPPHVELTGYQLDNIGSQAVDIAHWQRWHHQISQLISEYDGLVLLHGTDTLEETAYFLNLTLASHKPVVITGAMRPATAIGSDGPSNLLDAIQVASCRRAYNSGVLVVFSGQIFSARGVRKVSTTRLDAFADPDAGSLGQVHGNEVRFHRELIQRHTSSSEFAGYTLRNLARVAILYGYTADTSYQVHAVQQQGEQGLIMAGVGNGNLNPALQTTLSQAVAHGLVVVRASRTHQGAVTAGEIDDEQSGFVRSPLSPVKSRILLMLALPKVADRQRLQQLFNRY